MSRPRTIFFIVLGFSAALFGLLAYSHSSKIGPAQSIEDWFADNPVPVIALKLEPEAMRSLEKNPRRDVMAGVSVAGLCFEDAQVHLKGEGSFRSIHEKPSLTIHLPQKVFGVTKIHLNNSVEDHSFIQEELGGEIFRSAGIPTPRVGHARVIVNGQNKGLYVLKEGFTREFLARNSLAAEGRVYDSHSFTGADARVADLLRAAEEPDLQLRWQKVNDLLDVERFLSFAALEVLICHWDGYALANNNFRAYREAGTGRFIFLPAGMDQLFGNPAFPLAPDMTGALARRLMEMPEGREGYTRKIREFAGTLNVRSRIEEARQTVARLRPNVSHDEFQEMQGEMEDLGARILARDAFIQRQVCALAPATP